jgi:hypothetical protein
VPEFVLEQPAAVRIGAPAPVIATARFIARCWFGTGRPWWECAPVGPL